MQWKGFLNFCHFWSEEKSLISIFFKHIVLGLIPQGPLLNLDHYLIWLGNPALYSSLTMMDFDRDRFLYPKSALPNLRNTSSEKKNPAKLLPTPIQPIPKNDEFLVFLYKIPRFIFKSPPRSVHPFPQNRHEPTQNSPPLLKGIPQEDSRIHSVFQKYRL